MEDQKLNTQIIYVRINHEANFNLGDRHISQGEDFETDTTYQVADNILLTMDKLEWLESYGPEGTIKLTTLISYPVGQRRFDAFVNLTHERSGIIWPTENLLPGPKKNSLPGTIDEFIKSTRQEWTIPGKRLLKLVRWRFDLQTDFESLKETISLSTDGKSWITYRDAIKVSAHGFYHPIQNDKPQEIQNLLDKGLEEPLAMDLLDEARRISSTNMRGALALAVTALEVGTKLTISALRPEAGDSLFKIQSPPVEFLITHFLPELTPNFRPDSTMLENIKKIVQIRNELVHTGKFSLSDIQAEGMIRFVKRMLYVFDILQGREWATAFNVPYTVKTGDITIKV